MAKSNRFRPWANLPTDLLSSIADRLAILELLSFRATCKDFRRASCYASASIESSTRPWLLAHHPDPNTGNCFIYKQWRPNPYIIHLPEVKACMFLASYQGWLLVFKPKQQGSMFFFSPFSRAKIHLPNFPLNQIQHHATAFSDPPTSAQCIVSIRTPNEVFVISKGQTTWTRYKAPETISVWPVTTIMSCATFDHTTQTFYYLDNLAHVVKFCVKDCKLVNHPVNDINSLPFRYVKDPPFDQLFRHMKREYNIIDPFHLKQGEYLNLCGCTLDDFLPKWDQKLLFPNAFVNKQRGKHRDKRWGVWIQPRFYQTQPHHKW